MNAQQREIEKVLGEEVPVTDGVQRVFEDLRESEAICHPGRIDRQRCSRERARAQRRDIRASSAI